MALLIEKNLEILGGLSTNQLYLRFSCKLEHPGNFIYANVKKYVNKNSYSTNTPSDGLIIEGIPDDLSIPYNRQTDGVDILSLVHDKFKEELSTDKTIERVLRDPSTGEILYDPSTGERLFESIIAIPKFAEINEISIVDLDSSIS